MVDDLDGLTPDQLTELRDQLLAELDQTAVFTPGSFQEEWRRCGKPNCHCAKPDDKGHGPFYSVERWQGGRTRKQKVPVALVEQVRDRVAAWDKFQQVCARIADINAEESKRLLLNQPSSALADQKGGFVVK